MGEPPDASNWSVADVTKYFTDVGFVEQAETFRAEASVTWHSCVCFQNYYSITVWHVFAVMLQFS